MRLRIISLCALAAASASAGADDVTAATAVVCTPQPVICTTFAASSNDRFTPLVQHLLVRSQLEAQPKGWQMVFLYVPSMDTRALEELQIRFLDELLARQKAEAARKSADETDESGVEDPHTWTTPKEGAGTGAKRNERKD